ncbi:MAG TPA: hypothetical protein VJ249_03050 [Candidatus Bathyarchaeia archaeon]|nr:hypothetical protein [Candidatus Bathyarchaeia archaeon]
MITKKSGIEDQQLRVNPFPNVIIGDFDNDIVKVDLDNCYSIKQPKCIADMLNNRFKLDGYIILRSSTKTHTIRNEELTEVVYRYKTRGYHIVFNREVSESENRSILAWLCLQLKDENLTKWFVMQCIHQTNTLRHGFKGKKIRPPKIVFRHGNQDKMIAKFLDNRQYILDFYRMVVIKNGR